MIKFLAKQSARSELAESRPQPCYVQIQMDLAEQRHVQSWDFEFTTNYCFHVSLRPRQSSIVINEFFEEKYLDETVLPYIHAQDTNLILVFSGSCVKIIIGGKPVGERRLAVDLGLAPAYTCSQSGAIRLAEHAYEHILSPASQKRTSFSEPTMIFGVPVLMPHPSEVARLRPINIDSIRLFLEAIQIFVFGGKTKFIDASNTGGILASVISGIYPDADVFWIYDEKDGGTENYGESGNVPNGKIVKLESEKLCEILLEGTSERNDQHILPEFCLVGANIFGGDFPNKRRIFATLSAGQNKFTVITNEQTVIRSCEIFSRPTASDVYVNVFWSDWRFIWNSARQQMPKPKLDIVVATFNAKEYIEHCVRSLVAEQRSDIRVVVVDDGSTDGSKEIVTDLCSRMEAVILHSKPNGGCASARNYGRLKSDASHFAFVDADDYVDPGTFDLLFDLALYSSQPVVQCGFQTDGLAVMEESAEHSDSHLGDRPAYGNFRGSTIVKLDRGEVVRGAPGIWRRVYRRDFLDGKNIWFPEHIRAYDDFIFFVLTVQYSEKILHLADRTYYYRQHIGQDVRKRDARHFNVIEMSHMLLQRATVEAWSDIDTLVEVIRASVNWSLGRVHLRHMSRFISGVAGLVASIDTTFGHTVFPCKPEEFLYHPDFQPAFAFEKERCAQAHLGVSYAGAFIRTSSMTADIVEAMEKVADPRHH